MTVNAEVEDSILFLMVLLTHDPVLRAFQLRLTLVEALRPKRSEGAQVRTAAGLAPPGGPSGEHLLGASRF